MAALQEFNANEDEIHEYDYADDSINEENDSLINESSVNEENEKSVQEENDEENESMESQARSIEAVSRS